MKLSNWILACGLLLGIGSAHADTIAGLPPLPDVTFADTMIGSQDTLVISYTSPFILNTAAVRYHIELMGSASFSGPSDFIIGVASGASTVSGSFDVFFHPASVGPSNGTLSIVVSDLDANFIPLAIGTVTAAIQGNGVPVPGPALGAGLPGFVAACGGLWAWALRHRGRRRKILQD